MSHLINGEHMDSLHQRVDNMFVDAGSPSVLSIHLTQLVGFKRVHPSMTNQLLAEMNEGLSREDGNCYVASGIAGAHVVVSLTREDSPVSKHR